MARIRTIKPEFWTSEQVVECSPAARLLFIGLWNFCDDCGRHPASYRRLKMEVLPSDSLAVKPLVDELIAADLLIEYDAQGQRYWQVTGWHHQRIDNGRSKYPAPPTSQTFDKNGESSRNIREKTSWKGKGKGKRKGKRIQEESARKFVPPTVDEVREYAAEAGLTLDAAAFCDHFTSNGWLVGGRTKMKDWKAAVRQWARRDFGDQKHEMRTRDNSRSGAGNRGGDW